MEEVLSLAEQMQEEFMRLYDELDVESAPEKRKADIIDSIWLDVYNLVFKASPEDIKVNNHHSKLLTHRVLDVQEVCEMYIRLCKRYGGVIKIQQFANLTGIHRATLWLWNNNNNTNNYIFILNDNAVNEEYSNLYIVNSEFIYQNNNPYCERSVRELSSSRFDVIKKLREEMQDSNTNALSNDTMGQVVRANNEEELGKLYEPKRMMMHEQVRTALPAAELPKLSDDLRQSDTDFNGNIANKLCEKNTQFKTQ